MTKFLKIIKILQESLIRNCSSKNFQQPSKYFFSSDVNGNLPHKQHKHRETVINELQRSIWFLGSNLERSFLFKIPPTLTVVRGLTSRYVIPPKAMSKAGPKRTFEIERLTLIPSWMKKTKIKKFHENMVNVKDTNHNTSQTKTFHEFNVSGPKFKMINLINKKSKTIQLMTESIKPRRFYKTVMKKIALPHFETRHLIMKKKTNDKVSLNSQNVLENSVKKIMKANCIIPMNKCNMTDQNQNRNRKAGESLIIRNPPQSQVTIENNTEKSLAVVSECGPMRPIKNDDRSRIRRNKIKNVIAVKDEKTLKLKAKYFEKPEVDMFIKKLAAKYGKTVVQKSAKPKRIYENNRPRIKYDLDAEKYLMNTGRAGPVNKTIKIKRIETNTSHYSKKKLKELIIKDIENSSKLKKENNIVDQRTTQDAIEVNPSGKILRKDDLIVDKQLQIGTQFMKKKANSAVKLNSKNGFLKDRDKHIMIAEKRKKELKMENSSNSENITRGGKGVGCTNVSGIKPIELCQNKKKILKDQTINSVPKNIVNSLIIAKTENNKTQKEIISNTDENYESLANANKTAECQKTEDKSKILLKNQRNKETKQIMSGRLGNKINELLLHVEKRAEENKNKKNLPSKEESIKNIDKKLSLPMKLYAFHCHSECLDYKVYKYDNSPSISLETNQSDTVKPNLNDVQTGNLVQINNLKKGGYKCFERQKRPLDVNNVNLTNINTVRIRSPPIVNFRNNELAALKGVTVVEQLANQSVLPTKGENIPLIPNKVSKAKYLTLDLENNLKLNFDILGQIKGKQVTTSDDAENKRNSERKENMHETTMYLHLSGKDKESSANTKTLQTINIKKQTADEGSSAKCDTEERAVCANDKISPQFESRKLNKPDESKLDYSHRELKKILPFLKHTPNKAINNSKKEDKNLESIKSKEQTEEKKPSVQKGMTLNNTNDSSLGIPHKDNFVPLIRTITNKSELNNKHNPNVLSITYSAGQSKANEVKSLIKENPKFKVQNNGHLEDIQLANHIKPNSTPSKQLAEISLQDKLRYSNMKEDIKFPKSDNQNKTAMNVFFFENTENKQKQDLRVWHPTMIGEMHIKQHKTHPNPKSEIFDELIINKFILNKNLKKNLLLMHGCNRVSFLKVIKDIHQLTSEMSIFPNHNHMIAINTNTNEVVIFKNNTNELRVLEYDFMKMLCQQLQLNNRIIKHNYPEVIRQNKNFKIYDLYDSTFILQCFNKDPQNRNSLKNNLVEKNLYQPHTSYNYFEFVNGATETKIGKIMPMERDITKHVSNMMKQMKTDGRMIIKQNPKDTSIVEVLDCRIPQKSVKSIVRESSTEEAVTQKFNLINSKNMCFYSKYRIDCTGQNNIMEHNKVIANQEDEDKNTNIVSKSNIKEGSISSLDLNFLESEPKGTSQGIPINMKKSTSQEIYDCNHGKKFEIKDTEHKMNNPQLNSKDIKNVGTKGNLEKESSLNIKQEDKNTNLYIQACSEANIDHSLSVKENSNKAKIEPEVLYYMQKLDILCSNNGFATPSNNTNILEKNTNQPIFRTKTIQEKPSHINKSNKHSNNKIKYVSDYSRDEVKKTGNRYVQEISYLTDIKLLEKNTTDISDVINKCRKGTFEYLTKLVKEHKMGASSSSINGKKEKSAEIASQNHKGQENVNKSLHKISILPSTMPKMTIDKNLPRNRSATTNFVKKKGLNTNDILESPKGDLELKTKNLRGKNVSLNKDTVNGYKPEMNTKKTEGLLPNLVQNNANSLDVIKSVKEQEKRISQLNNLKNNEECNTNRKTNQITSSNKNIIPINVLNNVGVPTKNQLSLGNVEPTKQKSLQNNISSDGKNKIKLDSKIGLTKSMSDTKTADYSFKDMCLKTEGLNNSKNMMKTTNTSIKNYRSCSRARKKTHLQNDNTRISNNLRKDVYEAHTVLNKKYLKIQNDQNTQTLTNTLIKNSESKNLARMLNFQNGSRQLDKITEKNMADENIKDKRKEVSKQVMDYKSNGNLTCTDAKGDVNLTEGSNSEEKEQNDINAIINKTINISDTNTPDNTGSIPSGLRCMRQLKIEADKDKEMEKFYLKKLSCDVESIKLKGRERKHMKSPLRKEIGKSVTRAKPKMTADCGTSPYLLKHKKQLETITSDKRVKSIKNKLSNNLKPRNESKIFNRKSHTLMSFRNAESCKQKNKESKIYETKKGKEGFFPQKNSINKTKSISEFIEQTGSARDTNGTSPETGNYSNCNFFFDSKINPIKMLSEEKKTAFNFTCSRNDFKQTNKFKDEVFTKIEYGGLNFIQQKANVRQEKKKEANNIGSSFPLHPFTKIIKTNKKSKHREIPIYILKAQPKTEGFISQTLRSSNTQKKSSSKMNTATIKKRQPSHLLKHRVKSELKESATYLKKKISKHRLLKTDLRFKDEQKKNQSDMKLAQFRQISSKKGFPIHVFKKEQKKTGKNYLSDTPSRQVCALTPPIRKPKEKPEMPKAKLITKLMACTKKQDDVQKQNLKVEKNVKNYRNDISFINKIHNITLENDSSLSGMCKWDKGSTSAQNLSGYPLTKSETEEVKAESKVYNKNLVGTKDLISDIEPIISQSKPAARVAKICEGNDVSNCELITGSKDDINLHSIVSNVVNNVKSKTKNFLLVDIAKSLLNRGIISKKGRQQLTESLKEKSTIKIPKLISTKKNVLTKINQNTEQALCNLTNQVQADKLMKTEKNNKDDNQERKTVSDLMTFKAARNKQTCPQMSYSEVLNKFYAGCET